MGNSTVTSFIAGASPLSDGIALLLIQIIFILGLSRLIAIPLSYFRQPRVIAEVIAGILLGPTALGHWSWFSSNFFPTSSINTLNMLANLGLILFLLMMGLEVDLLSVRSRIKTSIAISASGFITTFALSIGVSNCFYYSGMGNSGNYWYFLLFMGVCMSVTAFPVLARILTDRKLLRTNVGVSVISAAAIDDALGWTFLALVVSLINASSALTALWVFLVGLSFAIFMLTIVKMAVGRLFDLIASKSPAASHDINPTMMVLAIVICFTAAWFTDSLGIHPIFGAFLTGLSMPREGGFNVKFTERIEDLVSIVLLPLYFTYSGLNTNISTMNGMSVLYLLLVLAAVSVGKIGGCSIAARFVGRLPLREALSVGVLMNTKGLVELIFLNIGLQAGILSQQTFAVMVLMAVITTMTTTPLVSVLYPSHVQTVFSKNDESDSGDSAEDLSGRAEYPVLLCLTTPTVMPSMMALLTLVRPAVSAASLPLGRSKLAKSNSKEGTLTDQSPIHVARIVLDSDRMSSTMIAAADPATATRFHDIALGVFATFAAWRGIPVFPHILVSKPDRFAEDVGDAAFDNSCGMVVVPFNPYSITNGARNRASSVPPHSPTSAARRTSRLAPDWLSQSPINMGSFHPSRINEDDFDAVKEEDLSSTDDLALQLVRRLRARVGIIVDRTGEAKDASSAWPRANGRDLDVLLPFFGGPDCREALNICLRSATAGSCNLKVLIIKAHSEENEVKQLDKSAIVVDPGDHAQKVAVKFAKSGDLTSPIPKNGSPLTGPSNPNSPGEGVPTAVSALTEIFRRGSMGGVRASDSSGLARKLSLANLSFKGDKTQHQRQKDRTTRIKSHDEMQDEEILNQARALESDGGELAAQVTVVTITLKDESEDPIAPVLEAIANDNPSLVAMGRFGPHWNQSLISEKMLAASGRTYGYDATINGINDLVPTASTPTVLSRVDSSAHLTLGPGVAENVGGTNISTATTDASPRRGLKTEIKEPGNVIPRARKHIISECLGPTGARIIMDNIGTASVFVVRKVRISKSIV